MCPGLGEGGSGDVTGRSERTICDVTAGTTVAGIFLFALTHATTAAAIKMSGSAVKVKAIPVAIYPSLCHLSI